MVTPNLNNGSARSTNGYHGNHSEKNFEPLAIVGMSCRFAGQVSSIEGLWDLIREKRTGHGVVPESRWNADGWYHPDPDRKGAINMKHGSFLEQDLGAFDANFFSTTAREASGMDPSKRLLLEVAYEAFENAGMPMEAIAGSNTGVYVGNMGRDYEAVSTADMYNLPYMAGSGTSEAMTANRVSWAFDLRGPSLSLDTACSSSLYALHLACQSLRLRETNMGLVAGVNVILHPKYTQQLVAMHMVSPDGISHSFDSSANGYGRGEGIGALVVKRLSDAIRDGDTIRSVIRGTSVNVDGRTPSVTMPSAQAQAELIKSAYQDAGLPLAETQYVELHGTGTPVGDPIEVAAIAQTFGASASPEKPVFIGSIKPNIGHTEGCAGLAGVFKAVIGLEKGIIPPTAGVENVNPKLKLTENNLAIALKPEPWPTQGCRRISVNSFGFGGANAHVILDDAYHFLKEHGLMGNHATFIPSLQNGDATNASKPSLTNGNHENGDFSHHFQREIKSPPKKLFVFSSRDEAGITRIADSLRRYCETNVDVKHKESAEYAANLAYTLANRRSRFDFRSFGIASSTVQLAEQLNGYIPKFKKQSKQRGIAFVFTGQGAQWPGMGSQLMRFPVFAASIGRSKAILDAMGCPFDVATELHKVKDSKIDLPEYSQPICTLAQIALVDLLADWGIVPKAVVGHSSGEIAAAYAAGILQQDDAVKVAYLRGVYSGKVANGPKVGAMLAAGISQEDAEGYLEELPPGRVVVACINSLRSVTLSGDAEYMTQLETAIKSDGKFARMLRVKTAYHSPHMQSVAEESLAAMETSGIGEPSTTTTQMFSSVTGELIHHNQVNRGYWVRNMCSPVRFSEAVTAMLTYSENKRGLRKAAASAAFNLLIEVGPHAALKGPLTQIMESTMKSSTSHIPYTSMLVRSEDAESSALKAAGHMWSLGCPLLLSNVNQEADFCGSLQNVIDLPAYPFNHEKTYWHESAAAKDARLQREPRTDLLGVVIDPQKQEPEWMNYLRVQENPWMEDHKITGTTLYPASGLLIMVIEAAQKLARSDSKLRGIELNDVHFERGLIVPGEDTVETKLSVTPCDRGSSSNYSFSIFSRIREKSWTLHCSGLFSILYDSRTADGAEDLIQLEWKLYTEEFSRIKQIAPEAINVSSFYESLYSAGMQFGPTFQNVTSLQTITTEEATYSYGTVAIPDTARTMPFEFEYPHLIHPATLDSLFHLDVPVAGGDWSTEAAVPFMMERMFIAAEVPQSTGSVFSGYSRKVARRDKQLAADLFVSDEHWKAPKLVVQGFVRKQVGLEAAGGLNSLDSATQKLTAEIVWKLDPNFITSSSVLKSQQPVSTSLSQIKRLRDWLDIECHKSATLSVLLVGSSLPTSTMDELAPFVTGESPYRGFLHCTILDSEDRFSQWKEKLGAANVSDKVAVTFKTWHASSKDVSGLDSASHDVIIVGRGDLQSEQDLSPWNLLASQRGRLLIVHDQDNIPTSNCLNLELEDNSKLAVVALSPDPQPMDRPRHGEVYLLTPDYPRDHASLSLVAAMRDQLLEQGLSTSQVHLDNADAALTKDAYVVSFLDLDNAFTLNWSPIQFKQFQELVASARHIFWLSRGGSTQDASEAGLSSAPVTGLFRVLRNEFPKLTLANLDLSPSFDVTKSLESARFILDTWLALVDEEGTSKELELAEVDGHIMVPRVVASPDLDMEIALTKGSAPPETRSLSSAGPLELFTGDRRAICWKTDEAAASPLEPGEVQIRVLNASVDLSRGMGKDRHAVISESLASQVTGLVIQSGSSVEGFVAGDLVAAFGSSTLRTHMRHHHSALVKLPENTTAEGAATTLWLYAICIYILKYTTNLTQEQTIFIQDGTTSLGQALICVAQHYGAHVLVGVKTAMQKEDLAQRLHVTRSSIIIISDNHSSALNSFLLHKTQGRGLDVLVGLGSGVGSVHELATSMSAFGHLAIVSDDSKQLRTSMPSLRLRGNISLCMIDTSELLKERSQLVSELLAAASELVRAKSVASISPMVSVDVSGLADTLKLVDELSSGVMTVDFSADSPVPVMPPPPSALDLNQGATYVLAGGLGSLGLRIASLLVRNGAKHVTFLSRSGNGKYAAELAALNSQGCETLALKCDITSADSVKQAVSTLAAIGRPIKGVVQCAMVLQDSLFHDMTYDQWQTCFAPKVAGSWNLHTHMSRDLEFFVMLSSATAVTGNRGQGNYASANTYMDALAHYRRANGLPGVAINAGLVADDERKVIDGTRMTDFVNRFRHLASVATSLEGIDTAMLAAMRGTTAAAGASIPAQFIFTMTDELQPEGADHWALDNKFVHRWAASGKDDLDGQGGQAGGRTASELLAAAKTLPDAAIIVTDLLRGLLAPALGVQPQDIDDERPLYDLGVDSLSAIEIRNKVIRDMESDVSIFEILSPASLADLSARIASRSKVVTPAA